MDTTEWNPGTLIQMSGYYWKTCTLHTGVKLDIFTAIGSDLLSSADICKKINGNKRGLSMLLNALAALKLLTKKDDLYSNTPVSKTFLSKESPQYIGFMIMHHHYLMESWLKMDEAMVSGKPTRQRSSFSEEKRRESFLMGMFNSAMLIAPNLTKNLDLTGCNHLLDLGGGPGTFAIHFCLNHKGLKAKIYDLPTTRPFAEKTIEKCNVSDRVEFIDGNYIEDEFTHKNEFDVVWLSHILHSEGPENAEKILGIAVSSLKPEGKIFIHDFILNNTMDSPLFPALFSINMFLGTDKGQSYSEKQLCDMLKTHGVKNIKRLDFVGPTESGIIMGNL